jgi:hypothetical protein
MKTRYNIGLFIIILSFVTLFEGIAKDKNRKNDIYVIKNTSPWGVEHKRIDTKSTRIKNKAIYKMQTKIPYDKEKVIKTTKCNAYKKTVYRK